MPDDPSRGLADRDAPYSFGTAVTTGVELPAVSRALYIATAGQVTAHMRGGNNAVTFAAVPAGTILPIRTYLVTTAPAGTVALW